MPSCHLVVVSCCDHAVLKKCAKTIIDFKVRSVVLLIFEIFDQNLQRMRGPQEPPPKKLFFNAVEKCEIFVEHVFLFPSCSRHPLALSSLALMLTLGKIYPQDRLAQPVAVQLLVVVGQEPEHPLAALLCLLSARLEIVVFKRSLRGLHA